MINSMTNATSGAKGSFYLNRWQFTRKRSQDWRKSRKGNWRQGFHWRPWRNVAYWIAFHCFPTLLSWQLRANWQVMAQPTVGWAFPNQPSTKKRTHRLASRLLWWRHFFSSGSLFPSETCLCQVEKLLNVLECSLIAANNACVLAKILEALK